MNGRCGKRKWIAGVSWRQAEFAALFLLIVVGLFIHGCGGQRTVPVRVFYDYDASVPLSAQTRLVSDTGGYLQYHLTYRSAHEKKVTAFLYLPDSTTFARPWPVILFLHGINNSKKTKYVRITSQKFVRQGWAVLSMDGEYRGERRVHGRKLTGRSHIISMREAVVQSVKDLRRGLDYLIGRGDIDGQRVGFMGVSLGGITGTMFCALDKRVDVVVLALSAGLLKSVAGLRAISGHADPTYDIIEPTTFIGDISPRPVLMINAQDDEVFPRFMVDALYESAGEPKRRCMLPGGHETIPLDATVDGASLWFRTWFKKSD
jgi:uncharacterized protein